VQSRCRRRASLAALSVADLPVPGASESAEPSIATRLRYRADADARASSRLNITQWDLRDRVLGLWDTGGRDDVTSRAGSEKLKRQLHLK